MSKEKTIVDVLQRWYDDKEKQLDEVKACGPIPGMVYRINGWGEYATRGDYERILPSDEDRELYRVMSNCGGEAAALTLDDFLNDDDDEVYYTEFEDLCEFSVDEVEMLKEKFPNQFNEDGTPRID